MAGRKGGLPQNTANILLGAVTPPPLPPLDTLALPPVRPVGHAHDRYPFENLCFEGGGAKGIAYCGALSVLEETGVYPDHIRRVAGTSSGSMFAALVAVGWRSDELRDLLFGTDVVGLMRDARFGRLSEVVNLFTIHGFNPGFKLMDFLGDLLGERTGAADVTFAQLHQRCGRELCVPITNITRMVTEYCHPKTTPDMPVRLAVSMSMSLPVLMQPYRILRRIGRKGIKEEDVYTDGGLLCNYPLHAFDGWWLSMQPDDTFVRRMRPLKDAARFMHPSERFHPRSEQTLGFTVYDRTEQDFTSAWQVDGAGPPARPDTELSAARAAAEAEAQERQAESAALEESFDRLVHAMDAVEQDGDGQVSLEEAERLFDTGKLTTKDADLLFGTSDVHAIFERLDHNGDGQISYAEIIQFMDSHNIDLTARAMGTRRSEISGVAGFMGNVFGTMLSHIRRSSLSHDDRYRTVPVDTDYIGTADFALEDGDRQFLLDTGAKATRAFLADWERRQ
jgi:arachidonate 5-lipoxygenase